MRNRPVQITRGKRTRIEPADIAATLDLSREEQEELDALADLLQYPGNDWDGLIETARRKCMRANQQASEILNEFCDAAGSVTPLKLRELYTRTFDLSPVCPLEIGYHLFGEDYKRGEFLANLRESENGLELGQEFQLPDHLPVILRLVTATDDSEFRAELVGFCLIPALRMMNDCFDSKPNLYSNLIMFACKTLEDLADRSFSEIPSTEKVRCQYV